MSFAEQLSCWFCRRRSPPCVRTRSAAVSKGKALVLFSLGFYIRPKLDAEKESVAKKRGDVFVNMEGVRARKDAHGRFNHPGDLGMELIAERFWQHIEPRVRDIR